MPNAQEFWKKIESAEAAEEYAPDVALDSYRELAELATEDDQRVRVFIDQAMLLMRRGDVEAATLCIPPVEIERLDALTRAVFFKVRAHVKFEASDFAGCREDAIKSIRDAESIGLEAADILADSLAFVGFANVQESKFEAAIDALDRFVALGVETSQTEAVLDYRIACLLAMKSWTDALAALDEREHFGLGQTNCRIELERFRVFRALGDERSAAIHLFNANSLKEDGSVPESEWQERTGEFELSSKTNKRI